MVAISLYKGNLHKAPDVSRRWTTPKPSISLKDFNTLLRRRSRALSRLNTPSIPNPNPNTHNNKEEELVGDKSDSLVEVKNDEIIDKSDIAAAPGSSNTISDKEKRIKEVKEKLEILNEKKHSLVQVLKQIMNAEEQVKRLNSTQGRPSLPVQVDNNATDSGSMTKVNTLILGSDGNRSGETDGGVETNLQSLQLPRMTSTSPSSDSQQKKPPSNMNML